MNLLRLFIIAGIAAFSVGLHEPAQAQYDTRSDWGGTSNASSPNAQTLSISNYDRNEPGVPIRFLPGAANTSTATLNISGVGAVTIKLKTPAGLVALTGGELNPSQIATVTFDGSVFELDPTATATAPTQTIFTSSSGTYTPPAGVKWLRVRLVGGGGGGGGAKNGSGAQSSAGNGGGGGGYVELQITNPAASYSFAAGAGGSGGTNAGTSGAAGSNSTFSGPGVSMTGAGGGGGTGDASPVTSTEVFTLTVNNNGGGASGGGLNVAGGSGGIGVILASGQVAGGVPGASFWAPAPSLVTSGSNGVGATGPGGGGGGASSSNAVGGFAGGNGAAGQIIIDEHYNF